jgi:hypothetical protein
MNGNSAPLTHRKMNDSPMSKEPDWAEEMAEKVERRLHWNQSMDRECIAAALREAYSLGWYKGIGLNATERMVKNANKA